MEAVVFSFELNALCFISTSEEFSPGVTSIILARLVIVVDFLQFSIHGSFDQLGYSLIFLSSIIKPLLLYILNS